jgi:ABC-2 type transport system ATP-binding protein
VFLVRSSDDRELGATLIGRPAVTGVEVTDQGLSVRANDYGTFSREIATLTRDRGIRLRELLPEDESLESVFTYLIDADGPKGPVNRAAGSADPSTPGGAGRKQPDNVR